MANPSPPAAFIAQIEHAYAAAWEKYRGTACSRSQRRQATRLAHSLYPFLCATKPSLLLDTAEDGDTHWHLRLLDICRNVGQLDDAPWLALRIEQEVILTTPSRLRRLVAMNKALLVDAREATRVPQWMDTQECVSAMDRLIAAVQRLAEADELVIRRSQAAGAQEEAGWPVTAASADQANRNVNADTTSSNEMVCGVKRSGFSRCESSSQQGGDIADVSVTLAYRTADGDAVYDIYLGKTLCPVACIGWFLGYPVQYWVQQGEDSGHRNNLGMVPLQLYTAWRTADGVELQRFSLPAALCNDKCWKEVELRWRSDLPRDVTVSVESVPPRPTVAL